MIGWNLSKLCAVGKRPNGAERQYASVLVGIETSEQMSKIAGKRLVVVVLQRHAVNFLPNNSDGKHFCRFASTFIDDKRVGKVRPERVHSVDLAAQDGIGQQNRRITCRIRILEPVG